MSRILIIVENLPVPLDRRVWQEACALRDAGHEVTVICPRMRGFDRAEEELEGIQIYRHWISGEGRGTAGLLLEYATSLAGEFLCALTAWRRRGFDVIHLCNPPDVLFLVALPFRWLAAVRIVYDAHDLWPEMFEAKFERRGLLHRAVRLAQRCTLALADAVLATNESVRVSVMRNGRLGPDEVTVVRTAPRRINTAAKPDPAWRNGRRFLAGYVGVMGRIDGVHLLIEAARHVIHGRKRDDVQFLLLGTGPEFGSLVRLRDALGLAGHVTMPGAVSDETLCGSLATMDVCVACDPINGYTDACTMNKTLEYMAFGKPQVMFGTREGRFSAGESASYVMQNDPAMLGDAIIELLDDEPRRARMGEAGKRRLEHELGWERSVEQLLRAYARVLEPRRAGGRAADGGEIAEPCEAR